jgi:hypothetical protein
MAKPNAKAPLGQGGRFAALKESLARAGNVSNPGAVAASIGRKKYGAKKMGKLSAEGRADNSKEEKSESAAKEKSEGGM